MSFDFALETKLKTESPELHGIFTANVLCCQNMLIKYKSVFPTYTDHTALHSLEVIAFCNEIIGSNINKLNADEIFVLLMAAYLHDTGMGISNSDYEEFCEEFDTSRIYRKENPKKTQSEIIRRFHNDFSGYYIKKYAAIFDFPTEEHLFAVVQASRGHRKTDLFDENEYPKEIKLSNGNVIRLPYITSLIRLADELDIVAERNIQFMYNLDLLKTKHDILEFKKHMAIKTIDFTGDSLVFEVELPDDDEDLKSGIEELFVKLKETLEYCVDVIRCQTDFSIKYDKVKILRKN